jgi:hypothetical protein
MLAIYNFGFLDVASPENLGVPFWHVTANACASKVSVYRSGPLMRIYLKTPPACVAARFKGETQRSSAKRGAMDPVWNRAGHRRDEVSGVSVRRFQIFEYVPDFGNWCGVRKAMKDRAGLSALAEFNAFFVVVIR